MQPQRNISLISCCLLVIAIGILLAIYAITSPNKASTEGKGAMNSNGSAAIIICSECGSENTTIDNYCSSCGNPVDENDKLLQDILAEGNTP